MGQIRSSVIVSPDTLPSRTASIPTGTDSSSTPAAKQAAAAGDSASLGGDDPHAARNTATSSITSGYNRDHASGTIVYQWIDQLTETVVMQIPKEQTVMTMKRVYAEVPATQPQMKVDRSV